MLNLETITFAQIKNLIEKDNENRLKTWQKVQQWRKNNPEKTKEQRHRAYLRRKERIAEAKKSTDSPEASHE